MKNKNNYIWMILIILCIYQIIFRVKNKIIKNLQINLTHIIHLNSNTKVRFNQSIIFNMIKFSLNIHHNKHKKINVKIR
jgi:hypothetical protein